MGAVGKGKGGLLVTFLRLHSLMYGTHTMPHNTARIILCK